jgi:hypothetical protein
LGDVGRHLLSQFCLERGQLGFDFLRRAALADYFFPVTPQELIDRLDTNPD